MLAWKFERKNNLEKKFAENIKFSPEFSYGLSGKNSLINVRFSNGLNFLVAG
jgi:hypothetical protein